MKPRTLICNILAFMGATAAIAQNSSGVVSYLEIYDLETRTTSFVVEMEEASSANILKGLRESALYLRNASYVK